MATERELPEIKIDGRTWLVDVDGYQIVDKENPDKRISALDMEYFEDGYRFAYSKQEQSLAKPYNQKPGDVIYVNLFPFTEMDPEGVAMKYGVSVEDVKGKTDYEVMTDKQVLIDRLQGDLPMIDIYGDTYYVDAIGETLTPKYSFLRNEILFCDLLDFYNKETGNHEIPYNYRTQTIENIDRNTIVHHPQCVVVVSFPDPAVLDPIGYAEAYGFDKAEVLKKIPQKMHHKAEILQGKDSWLNRVIGENRKRMGLTEIDLGQRKRDFLTRPKQKDGMRKSAAKKIRRH